MIDFTVTSHNIATRKVWVSDIQFYHYCMDRRFLYLIAFLMLNELLKYLPIAELPFNALSTMVSEVAPWSAFYSNVVFPDIENASMSVHIVAIEMQPSLFMHI